jgi:hypothetical protein
LSELKIISIKCGTFHSLALTQRGEVYTWGYNGDSEMSSGCYDSKERHISMNYFDGEKVIMISCGASHSLALTKSGRVFSWGHNSKGQLGVEDIKYSITPKHIKLNEVSFKKISCGSDHSLMLTEDGEIYACGEFFTQIHIKLKKLSHEKRFKDISSLWFSDFSLTLSFEDKFYALYGHKEEIYFIEVDTKYKSFNEIMFYYYESYLDISEELIEFRDFEFNDGAYSKDFEEIEKLGEGSYGKVFKVKSKDNENFYAIKMMKLQKGVKSENLRELSNFFLINRLGENFIVNHHKAWLERSLNHNILYIQMKLCDGTLDQIIDVFDADSTFKKEEKLTPIGYYIASQLFLELLECIQFLHKQNVIHRDLNPYNIMLVSDDKSKRFIRIGDFGLMALHEFTEQLHSRDKGQLKYMAPELEEGDNTKVKYNTKADIYSLGTILQNLLDIDFEG